MKHNTTSYLKKHWIVHNLYSSYFDAFFSCYRQNLGVKFKSDSEHRLILDILERDFKGHRIIQERNGSHHL